MAQGRVGGGGVGLPLTDQGGETRTVSHGRERDDIGFRFINKSRRKIIDPLVYARESIEQRERSQERERKAAEQNHYRKKFQPFDVQTNELHTPYPQEPGPSSRRNALDHQVPGYSPRLAKPAALQ